MRFEAWLCGPPGSRRRAAGQRGSEASRISALLMRASIKIL